MEPKKQVVIHSPEPAITGPNALAAQRSRIRKPPVPEEKEIMRPVKLSLANATWEKLAIHALRRTNGNASRLVTQLIDEHCRDFYVSRTPTRGGVPSAKEAD